jgi:hypothetical protein
MVEPVGDEVINLAFKHVHFSISFVYLHYQLHTNDHQRKSYVDNEVHLISLRDIIQLLTNYSICPQSLVL